jgi:hypothetical protein
MEHMFACGAMPLGLTEGALVVRELKKDEIEYELNWCDVIEARLTEQALIESRHAVHTLRSVQDESGLSRGPGWLWDATVIGFDVLLHAG